MKFCNNFYIFYTFFLLEMKNRKISHFHLAILCIFRNGYFQKIFLVVLNRIEGLFHGTFDPFRAKQGENLAGTFSESPENGSKFVF